MSAELKSICDHGVRPSMGKSVEKIEKRVVRPPKRGGKSIAIVWFVRKEEPVSSQGSFGRRF